MKNQGRGKSSGIAKQKVPEIKENAKKE